MTRSWQRRAIRSLLPVCAAMALLTSVAACASSATATSGDASGASGCTNITEPVKVGNISPLSGPAAALGKLNADAAKVAIDVFNQQNDICGQKIENVSADDKGDPATALNLGRKYVSEGVTVMTNIGMSETEDALAPFLQKEGVVVVGNSGKGGLLDPSTNPTYFSVYPSTPQYALAVVNQIKAQGWNNVGTMSDGTTFGSEYSAALRKYFNEAGITVTKSVTYSPTSIDLSAPVQEVKASGAEVLVPAGATAIPALVAAVKQADWQPHMISWGAFITYGIKSSDLPPGTLDGCQNYLPAAQAPNGTDGLPSSTVSLLKEAEQTLGAGSFGIQHSTSLYTQLLVIKAAVEKAGSTESAAVAAAIKSLDNVDTSYSDAKLSFTGDSHTGYPSAAFSFCQVDLGPYGIRYQAANLK